MKKPLVHRFRELRHFCLFAVICVIGAACRPGPLRPEPKSLEGAAPKLIDRLRADPYDYFRFVNRPWIARVCDVFGADLRDLPVVQLHGDAHVEQFAFTNDAWGLGDFDDSARGPALIDIVRFLGSIDVAARQRSWEKDRDVLFDRFFEGYRRGLAEPGYAPGPPDIVLRLRADAKIPATQASLLAWGESKMQPMADVTVKNVLAGVEAFAAILRREHPELAPGYFRVVRAGWLNIGVGSAVNPKILVRVQGPTDDPADDEILEIKKIAEFDGVGCLETPALQPTLRVIDGSKQLGRLKRKMLAAGPELVIPGLAVRGQHVRDWWLQSLDPLYGLVHLADLRSVGDLAGIIYDSGLQLGAGHLPDGSAPQGSSERKQALSATSKLEKRYRREATTLVDDLLRGWREFGAR
jgi:hypothetical protein